MRFRDHVALTLPPLFLRLTLCVIFLWAGLGKIMGEMNVTGDDAARLAQMGVQLDPADTQPSPARPLPEPNDADNPETTPPAAQKPTLPPPSELVVPEQPAATPATETDPADEESADETVKATEQVSIQPPAFRWTTVQNAEPRFTASDFPGDYTVQRVAGIALMISHAGNPGYDDHSSVLPATLPAKIASERWPIYLAWAAAISELLAAVLLFFGLMTRFAALMLIGTMLVAIWLTQIGPAVVGLTDAYLGFIPKADNPWSPASYKDLFFQLSCLTMAAAVMLLGSGPIGLDRAIWRRSERLERTDNPGKRERSTFDRSPSDTP